MAFKLLFFEQLWVDTQRHRGVRMKKKNFRQPVKSFEKLGVLLKESALPPLRSVQKEPEAAPAAAENPIEDDHQLFIDAMSDVTPLPRDKTIETAGRHRNRPIGPVTDPEKESVNALTRLVMEGEGFVVSSTPEYMEGTNYNVHPEISRRLHKGRFSIQAHLDLHGFTVAGAQEAFNTFFKEATLTGKRALLIIHGRGLSSPDGPVLKTKVVEWLTLGPWRKWVIAFSSARACDGGAGATYVLLRRKPVTKRMRKKSTAKK